MNSAWIAVLVSIVALIPGLYAFRSAWKTRSTEKGNVVFKNALELLETYKEETDNLRTKLKSAHKTIDSLTERINKLNLDLSDANYELGVLRSQVKTMSTEITEINGDRNESA